MAQNTSWQTANTLDVLQSVLSDAFCVSKGSWRKSGTSYSTTVHRGLKISRINGVWLVKDFSMSTIGDDKPRTAKRLIFHVYNLRTNREVNDKLAALTGINIENSEEKTVYRRELPSVLDFYYPNTNSTSKQLKTYYDSVKYGSWKTTYGQSVLYYIRHKTKADFETIKKSCRPILQTIKEGKVYNYTELKFAYAVYEGVNVRIFRPFLKSQGIDKMPLQNIGNYLFGFDNLPKDKNDCKVLFIVGGEHDCIAFNHAYNHLGWYAITQGSETQNLSKELVALLKTRCLRLVTFFDNDSAGQKGMDKHAREHGLQGIDLATYVNNETHFKGCRFDENGVNRTLNDICDILNTEGGQANFQKLINRELTTKQVGETMLYRPTFSNVFHSEINEYLCDTELAYLQLKNHLRLIRKLIMQSPTGTGKTYLMLHRWAKEKAFFELLGIKRIVYLCPTNSLGQQQADKHKIPFLSSLETVHSSEIAQSTVIAATFDQVRKMPKEWYDTSLFVIDEFHTLTSEFEYRAKTMRCLLNLIKTAKYVLGITATPNLPLVKHLNYGLCQATFHDAAKAQKINIQPIMLKDGGMKDILQDIEKRRDKNKVTVIKLDNVNVLNSFKQKLIKKHGEVAVTVISSKTDAMSVKNVHYQSLIKTGRVGEEARIVLCTKFLEAGVNFEFPAEIFYTYPRTTDSLLQMLARPRIDRILNINLEVNAFVYLPRGAYRTNDKIAALTARFDAFTNGVSHILPVELQNQNHDIRNTLEKTKKLCEVFNAFPESKGKEKYIKNDDFRIILNVEKNVYEVDELRIFHEKEVELQQVLRGDVIAFFAELKAVNPHVHVQPLEITRLDKDLEVCETLIENAKIADEVESKTATYFADVNTESLALMIAYFLAKNTDTRHKIAEKMGHTPLLYEAESARKKLGITIEEQGPFLKVGVQYLKLVETTKLVKYRNGVHPIKAADIQQNLPEILRGGEKVTNRLERLAERLISDHETTITRENAPTILVGRISNAIRQQIFKLRADRRIFSKTALFNIYNTAVQTGMESMGYKRSYPARNFKEVLNRIEALFEVKKDAHEQYLIGKEITAKNILTCQSIEVNDLTTMTIGTT
jgi:hypothetical protein